MHASDLECAEADLVHVLETRRTLGSVCREFGRIDLQREILHGIVKH
jgi:hypothetical protein